MTSDLNMTYEKMFDSVSFLLFGFTLVIKLEISVLEVIEVLYFFNKKI